MRLSWTNTEWDNFSGVASKDNLLMLNEGNDFLNAGGNDGNWRNDRKYYVGDEGAVDFQLDADRIRDKATGKITNDISLVKSKLEKYSLEAEDLKKQLEGVSLNVTTSDYTRDSQDNRARALANRQRWLKDRLVARLKAILQDIENAQEKARAEKAKADADAKAKAQAEADAKAEADRIAKMKALNDQLINAKTPEEKKSIQAQIDALVGNVAKGGSKTITYAIIGLVVVVGAYMLFKKKN